MSISFNTNRVGSNKTLPDARITFINGMRNEEEDCKASALYISKKHGNVPVDYVYDETSGSLTGDLFKGVQQQWGYDQESASARKLVYLWEQAFLEMRNKKGQLNSKARVYHHAHSRGGLITNIALDMIQNKPYKKYIVVSLYGSPVHIDSNKCRRVRSYVSSKDAIGRFSISKLWKGNYQVRTSSLSGLTLDHSFLGGTYAKIVEEKGARFQKDYQVKNR